VNIRTVLIVTANSENINEQQLLIKTEKLSTTKRFSHRQHSVNNITT